MLELAWIALFSPLIGSLILLFSAKKIGRVLTGIIGCGSIFLSLLCFAYILFAYTQYHIAPTTLTLYQWIPVADMSANFAIHIDPLSILMTLIITGVGFLIHVYANGYMDHDEDYARFFSCLNFFVFAMLLLVLAANLLLLFVGWEGVGLASYLLIGFWFTRPTAAQAATKAFVVNRVGDFGLLLGLLLTFVIFGTSDIVTINARAEHGLMVGTGVISLLAFLYFVGAAGKSAQLPLQVWLADAMEGPTPVSALIHAATMVTAGVYLVVRMHPVFMEAPDVLHFIGWVGGLTSLFAALCAVGQTDLKRVLAYSTVSQLGLMFLACGAGAFFAAIFHLTMHAFMKALLFLTAGNVVHMMHGTTQMSEMGGLSKRMPITHVFFIVGILAMSGIPPLAAFFSKDLILEEEYYAGFMSLFYIGLAASLLTAFYLTRAYCLTFTGKLHAKPEVDRDLKEARPIMLWPVGLLAMLSIFGGFLGFSLNKEPLLEKFLSEVDIKYADPAMAHGFHMSAAIWMSTIGGILAIAAGLIVYLRYSDKIRSRPIELFRKSFYFDEIFDYLLVYPLKALSRLISNFFEPEVFEGSINAAAYGTNRIAGLLQRVQSGQLRSYVAWMALGAVILIGYFIF